MLEVLVVYGWHCPMRATYGQEGTHSGVNLSRLSELKRLELADAPVI